MGERYSGEMKIMFNRLERIIVLVVSAFCCWQIAARFGRWQMVGVWAGAWAILCGVAAWLLSTTKVDQITWKNRVAGIVLSWGVVFNGRQLPVIALISWAVQVAVAITIAIKIKSGFAPVWSGESQTSGVWSTLALVGCGLYVAALMYLFSVMVKFGDHASGKKSILKLMAIVTVLLIGSIALLLAHQPKSAAMVALGPIVFVGCGYGLMVAAMLIFGRKTNWH